MWEREPLGIVCCLEAGERVRFAVENCSWRPLHWTELLVRGGDVAHFWQLVECLPGMHQAFGSLTSHNIKQGIVAHTYHPDTEGRRMRR